MIAQGLDCLGRSRTGPVTVLVAGDGRHLFESIHDDRVRTVRCTHDTPQLDLIAFPCGHDRRFEKVVARSIPAVPPSVRTQVVAGTVGVVFDASIEGVPHKPDIADSLHHVLHVLGASPSRTVYITQDRNYQADYGAYCGGRAIPPVAVLNHDYWIWQSLAQYEADGERVYQQRLAAFRARSARRNRRFISLNRTPRPTKMLFLLSLLRDGLWDAGFISFGGFRPSEVRATKPGKPKPSIQQLTEALPGFEDLVADLASHLNTLEAYGRVLFGLERHGCPTLDLDNAGVATDLAEYDQAWFSVVTETEMRPRPSRITEKAVKPLVNFHPLLVFGNPGALASIRSYGFQTFAPAVEESYDEECDPRRRFDLVYEQVLRLCRMSDDELAAVERRLLDALTFNAHWGLTRFPGEYRRRRDADLIEAICAAVRPEQASAV